MAAALRPQFVDGPRGRLFVVHHVAPECGECLLLLPPFAEEMNKSRQQVTLQARALARRGIGVVVADLSGTGDSDGALEDVSVDHWIDDLDAVVHWILDQGYRSVVPWGVRAGALLAAPLLARRAGMERVILWQPQTSGKMLINQFLRMQAVAGMMGGDQAAPSVKAMRARLGDGHSVEVAGYTLGAPLVESLDRQHIKQLADAGASIDWFARDAGDAGITPAESRTLDALRDAGVTVRRQGFVGEPFWATAELATAPALIELTTATLAGSP